MKKNNLVYIKHILDAISQIEEYVQGISHKDFISNNNIDYWSDILYGRIVNS